MELSHGCKTIGGVEWVSTPLCQVLWWLAVIYLDAEYSHSIEEGPCCNWKVALYPGFIKQEETSTHQHHQTKWEPVPKSVPDEV